MKKLLAIFLCLYLFFITCGCTPILVGAAVGGVAMYAVGKDTIQGDSETPYDSLWEAALQVAKVRGAVLQQDVNRGYILTDVGGGKLRIYLLRVTSTVTKVRVSARNKLKMPDLALAEQVFTKIIEIAHNANL
ncbi:MAG: DUF3568 domain-containing protein [Candidatus Omnitrophica bacterium]|nr:DUF3568 domain-containing protein [Candidatus Omnitrophota bacterium]